ncbi:mucolipin-3-like [Lingula anatina]|uniref:Mucolipin-3-like n=1 Tax=Lingula anatina TaxID=7574 RepID=A0A1S3IBK6_LINAN|nr:mucolipin-3-like [Lingula anatina]|eukprot:XP_013395241.1 mucolipin-3-like [Lingula anatina]
MDSLRRPREMSVIDRSQRQTGQGQQQVSEPPSDENQENLSNRESWRRSHGRPRPFKRVASFYTPHMEDTLRRKLKFHFMTPCQKWSTKRRFPWKMIIQLLKIVLVTGQLVWFGYDRSSHVNFLIKSTVSFKHLFLQGWDPAYETLPYPAPLGIFAVYTIDDFYLKLNHAWKMYNEVWPNSIGSFTPNSKNHTLPPMYLCKTFFRDGWVNPRNGSYSFHKQPVEECIALTNSDCEFWNSTTNTTEYSYDVQEYLQKINKTIEFDRLVKVEFKFSLRAVHVKNFDLGRDEVECFDVNVTILLDNSAYSGQIPVTLKAAAEQFICTDDNKTGNTEDGISLVFIVYDIIVIIISVTSTILCARSLYRAQRLRSKTVKFFKRQRGIEMTLDDRMQFLNLWFIMIIVNDVITVIGSVLKIMMSLSTVDLYEMCGLTLGTGSLLVWFGVLRYLNFFEKYNILIITMKRSFPDVLRYLICALMFYAGFTFCGWVVLGPYHVKFRTISAASECLFSLVNGDDMFVTFSVITGNDNVYIWYYSRAFLYIFISLFIYIILSLFIAVITNVYDVVRDYYRHGGFPETDLTKFINETDEDHNSPHYRLEDNGGCDLSRLFRCCCRRRNPDEPDEYSSLLTCHRTN